MTVWQALLFSFAVFLGLSVEIGLILGVAWVIVKIVRRIFPKQEQPSPKREASAGRGSLALIDSARARRQPVAFTVAFIAGAMGTVGVAMYWIGPLAGSDLICLIGFALAATGIIAAGIIYGTNDRDYYI